MRMEGTGVGKKFLTCPGTVETKTMKNKFFYKNKVKYFLLK